LVFVAKNEQWQLKGRRKSYGMIRKLDDLEWKLEPCKHPEHNIPGYISMPAGTYEYECPLCGAKQIFHVPEIRFSCTS
jgi:hypothetical protein